MSGWNQHSRTSDARFEQQQFDEHDPSNAYPLPIFRPYPYLEKHLPNRLWSNTNYQSQHRYFKIHLVCYNILAQGLLEENPFLYENCFRNNLKWYKRKDRLIRELLRQDADIFCLQEMQVDHYENEFRPEMMQHGYESIYLKRSGDKFDGCCIFYKINRLKLIASKPVPFYQSHIRLLDRDNCGLIALFQPLISNATGDNLFCVATTHLLFSTKRGDIKLAQLQYFLAEIDRLALRNPETNSHYPIILCGDFNGHPQSPLIQFLLTGHIKYDNYRCVDISGQLLNFNGFSYQLPSGELLPRSFVSSNCRLPDRIHFDQHTSSILTHNKQFNSVYDLNDSLDVTSNSKDEPKLVDYIFYTQQNNDPDRLNVLTRLELYKQDQMFDVHMPNHQFASDHFPLAVKFALNLR